MLWGPRIEVVCEEEKGTVAMGMARCEKKKKTRTAAIGKYDGKNVNGTIPPLGNVRSIVGGIGLTV